MAHEDVVVTGTTFLSPQEVKFPPQFEGKDPYVLYRSLIEPKKGLYMYTHSGHPKCFKGKELVNWLVKDTKWTSEVSGEFSKWLSQKSLIFPVGGRSATQIFENEKFYQFNALKEDNYELLTRPREKILSEYTTDKVECLLLDTFTGLPTKERELSGKTLKTTFTGIELVNWLQANLKLSSKAEAIVWAQYLVQQDVIQDQDKTGKFIPGDVVYFFPQNKLQTSHLAKPKKRPIKNEYSDPISMSIPTLPSALFDMEEDADDVYFASRYYRKRVLNDLYEYKKKKSMKVKDPEMDGIEAFHNAERLFRKNLLVLPTCNHYDLKIYGEANSLFLLSVVKIPVTDTVKDLSEFCSSYLLEKFPHSEQSQNYSLYLIPRDPRDNLNQGVILEKHQPLWLYSLELLDEMNLHLVLRSSHPNQAQYLFFLFVTPNREFYNVRVLNTITVLEFMEQLRNDFEVDLKGAPFSYWTIYVHTNDYGFWLLPELKLFAYPLKSMDIIELRKRQVYHLMRLSTLHSKDKDESDIEDSATSEGSSTRLDYNSPSIGGKPTIMVNCLGSIAEIVSSLIKWINKCDKKSLNPSDFVMATVSKKNALRYNIEDFNVIPEQTHMITLWQGDVIALLNTSDDDEAYPLKVLWAYEEENFNTIGNEQILQGEVTKQSLHSVVRFTNKKIVNGDVVITNYRIIHTEKIHNNTFNNTSVRRANSNTSLNLGAVASAIKGNAGGASKYGNLDLSRKVKGSTVSIPLASLLKYRTKKEKSKKSVVLEIECKNFRIVRFRFEKGDTNYDNMIKVLEFYMEPGVEDLFAFSFSYSKWKSKHLNGWEIYDPVLEFHRLGIRNEPMNETQNRYSQKWRITNFNHGNKVIQSYPKYLVVPASEDDNSLKKKLWLRKDNCIPVLSWIHPNSGAAILRSSQPTPLHQHKQSDTEYLVSIKKVSLNNLRIYDLRTKTAAQITKSPISGEEDEAEGGIKSLTFLDLSDSETLLHSISIICEAIYSHFDQSTFWQKIVESGWLDIQSKLLFSANMIIKVVDELNESVLLYCCDGSNQTPLLLSTVLLMLDPYYRTIKGFIILIEKEWISYGHKFSSNFNSQQPFFLSWMDATYQLLVQNPCAFEFNHNFLIYLMDELFSCRFGTFIYDSDYERNEHNLSQKTISIWSSVLDPNRMSSFTNPFYQLHPKKMVAQFEQGNLKLWEYFIRYTSMDCKENPVQEAITPETKAQQLMDHNLKLQKQIQVLEKQLANASTAIIKSTSTSKITNPRISRGSPHKIGFKRNTSQRLLESDKT